jgi:pilus assembly protein Flp/PilA
MGSRKMKEPLLNACITLRRFVAREEGQDMVEYALLIALVAFACTAGMASLANQINTVFRTVAATLTLA